MPIQLYNSLTRKKEVLEPEQPPKLKIYTCGVTVYDTSHIGHARSLYIFDVIRRYLQYRKYDVKFVRNITDIDDKIIKRANELKTDWKELVDKYIDSYHQDLKALGIARGDSEPRATENIKEMIKYIGRLIDRGYAYEAGGDVYFDVKKFSRYGKLSGQNIEQMESGARIEPSENKKDPLDFALWKRSKENEPSWKSPWGQGRPGWHIECSVMSQKFLETETLDIHAGGRDLIFPHHENEIAQAESLTGKPFAKYWIHHGLLTINGQKMSKSLRNFVTIKDFIKNYKDADLLKLFFLSAHYAHPIDFNQGKITECKKQKETFNHFFDKVGLVTKEGFKEEPLSGKVKKIIDAAVIKFENAMDDDFNMPVALAAIFELIDYAAGLDICENKQVYDYARAKAKELFDVFGLSVKDPVRVDKKVKEMALDMAAARREKDYQKSDRIRDMIKEKFQINASNTSSGISFTKVED